MKIYMKQTLAIMNASEVAKLVENREVQQLVRLFTWF